VRAIAELRRGSYSLEALVTVADAEFVAGQLRAALNDSLLIVDRYPDEEVA